MLETQKKWYIPAPTVLGWHIGFWNLIGALGFTLCGAFGFASSNEEYETALTWSTFIGSWAFLVSQNQIPFIFGFLVRQFRLTLEERLAFVSFCLSNKWTQGQKRPRNPTGETTRTFGQNVCKPPLKSGYFIGKDELYVKKLIPHATCRLAPSSNGTNLWTNIPLLSIRTCHLQKQGQIVPARKETRCELNVTQGFCFFFFFKIACRCPRFKRKSRTAPAS